MVAIQVFNEGYGKTLSVAHGCVTSGSDWRFLRLKGNLLNIDNTSYYLSDVARILGIRLEIAGGE